MEEQEKKVQELEEGELEQVTGGVTLVRKGPADGQTDETEKKDGIFNLKVLRKNR